MENPFAALESRLQRIENLLLDTWQKPQQIKSSETPEQFLTVEQAAEFLNLKVPTIYSKVSKGELPVMKRGKRLYFSSIELLAYLKGGKRMSSSEIDEFTSNYLSNKTGGVK